MRHYPIHTKQILAGRVSGLKYNGDTAAKPTRINQIEGPFIFVQQGNIWGKSKQDERLLD